MGWSRLKRKQKQSLPLARASSAAVAPVHSASTVDEKAKPTEATGSLDQEVGRLRDQMNLAIIVLFVGFAGIFVAVSLFGIEAAFERNKTYQELVDRVNLLDMRVGYCTYAPYPNR